MYGRIRGIGRVHAVEDGHVIVRVPRDNGELCKASCKGCALCETGKIRYLDIRTEAKEGALLRPGQRLVVEYRRRDPGLAAALFFLPPLFGLAAGAHALDRFAGGDWMFLAGAVAGFTAGMLASLGFIRLFPRLMRPEARIVQYE